MLKTEKLFTKLKYAYIMNYYRLKVACTTQINADVICLNHSHSAAVPLWSFIIFQSSLQYWILYFNFYLIYWLMILVYIIYCLIVNFSSVDIGNWNILLKAPHLHAADIIFERKHHHWSLRSYYLIHIISVSSRIE